MFHRSTPDKYLLNKHALILNKLFWSNDSSLEWVALNTNTILTTRQKTLISSRNNKKKVGLRAIANQILNGRIPIDMLNKSLYTYKVFCKKIAYYEYVEQNLYDYRSVYYYNSNNNKIYMLFLISCTTGWCYI